MISTNRKFQFKHRINNKGFAIADIVIAVAAMTFLIAIIIGFGGNVFSVSSLSKSVSTKNVLQQIKNVIIENARDVDSDTYYEVWKEQSGNGLPVGYTGTAIDAWGSALKYCTWDLGSANTVDTAYSDNFVTPPQPGLVARIISAGRDRIMQTSCTDTVAQGDDFIAEVYHNEINSFFGTGSFAGIGPDYVEPETKYLLHFDGENNSTIFKDSSIYNKTPTISGTPVISTAQKKFGTASGYFNGTGGIVFADSNDWKFGGEDFTVEAWIKTTDNQFVITSSHTLNHASGYPDNWTFYYYQGYLTFAATTNGSNAAHPFCGAFNICLYVANSTVVNGNWNHVAVSRYGNTLTMYVNGTAIGSTSISGSIYHIPNVLGVGFTVHSVGWHLNGYMDEFRITKGKARWKNMNFTPDTKPYTVSATYTCPYSGEVFRNDATCHANCVNPSVVYNCYTTVSGVSLYTNTSNNIVPQSPPCRGDAFIGSPYTYCNYHRFYVSGNQLCPNLTISFVYTYPDGCVTFNADESGITVSGTSAQNQLWRNIGSGNTLRWYSNQYDHWGETAFQGDFRFTYDANKNAVVRAYDMWGIDRTWSFFYVYGAYGFDPDISQVVLQLGATGSNCMRFYYFPDYPSSYNEVCLNINKTWKCPAAGGTACSGSPQTCVASAPALCVRN